MQKLLPTLPPVRWCIATHRQADALYLQTRAMHRFAADALFQPVRDGYYRLTGWLNMDAQAVRNHRISLYGSPCTGCAQHTANRSTCKTSNSMNQRMFGPIDGVPTGTTFLSRMELSASGIHRPLQAGISGSGKEGADSIVLSGGYEDDDDDSDTVLYTGHGGRDPLTGKQVGDQLLERGNLALALSCLHGLPVRVVRGANPDSPFAPASGYRYDGLFRVEDYWHTKGISGHTIWRFRLVRLPETVPARARVAEEQEPYIARRMSALVVRIIRDTPQARQIKQLYDYRCQVCGIRLEGSAGPYAEAAHIRPLGRPHNGPDTPDNILCLCPNHHALFDYGGFSIDDDLMLLELEGRLFALPEHRISSDHLRYHRSHYYTRL